MIRTDEDPVTAGEIDALLLHLATFEAQGFRYGVRVGPTESQVCFYTYARPAWAFVETLYETGWIVNFDWPSWTDEAKRLFDSPEALAATDAATIRRLLTLHARQDRFCEGHLAEMMECGHMVLLLRRLATIRAEMSPD